MQPKLAFLKGTDFPRIVKKLPLKEYSEEFAQLLKEAGQEDAYLSIWLNWSRDFQDKYFDAIQRINEIGQMPTETEEQVAEKEAVFDELLPTLFELNAEYWGCSAEDVRDLYETDVVLWQWINAQAGEARDEYASKRSRAKKDGGRI